MKWLSFRVLFSYAFSCLQSNYYEIALEKILDNMTKAFYCEFIVKDFKGGSCIMKKVFVVLMMVALIAGSAFAQGSAEKSSTPELKVVAFTCQDLGNPFFKLMGDAVTTAAKKINPDCQVIIQSGDNDLAKQSAQIDDFISAQADIIVLNACDSEGIAPAVRRAKEAGCVVIASDVTAAGGVDATMTSDNIDAGRLVAQYIVDRLGPKGGNVIAIVGDPVSATLDRYKGMKEVFAKHPEIKVLSEDQNGKGRRELSMNLLTDLLTKFPKVDAVWGCNDPTALGCELAIRQAGRQNEMFVVGVDGSPDAANSMAQPNSIFAATSAQDPYYMAYHAVEVGWDVMNGKKPEKEIELIPVHLITQEDVKNGYTGWSIPKN
jgi:ribose transport system substrate-binding protein